MFLNSFFTFLIEHIMGYYDLFKGCHVDSDGVWCPKVECVVSHHSELQFDAVNEIMGTVRQTSEIIIEKKPISLKSVLEVD